MTATAHELFRQGRLADAIAAQNDRVKSRPTDLAERGFLAEMLCFDGNLERADRMLEQMQALDAGAAVPLALLRQLVRADQARRAFAADGAVPEVLDAPGPLLRAYLQAHVQLRAGDPAAAAAILAEAEASRPPLRGSHDGVEFDDFRDLDDGAPGVLEVYTSTGKFFWIETARVVELEFHPPGRSLDLLWRRARMVVENGPEGEVFLPALYAAGADDDAGKLGLCTKWNEAEDGTAQGIGRRCFLVGDQDLSIMELGGLTFAGAG